MFIKKIQSFPIFPCFWYLSRLGHRGHGDGLCVPSTRVGYLDMLQGRAIDGDQGHWRRREAILRRPGRVSGEEPSSHGGDVMGKRGTWLLKTARWVDAQTVAGEVVATTPQMTGCGEWCRPRCVPASWCRIRLS
jgi:hypothetical protein